MASPLRVLNAETAADRIWHDMGWMIEELQVVRVPTCCW